MDETKSMRESYADVLSRLGSGATLPPQEAIDAEVERVAKELRGYLDVYREQLHTASLWKALNPMDAKDHRRLIDTRIAVVRDGSSSPACTCGDRAH